MTRGWMGMSDRALAMLNKARRHAPERADIFLHQGRLHTQMERKAEALSAYLSFAQAQVDAGHPNRALDVFSKIRMLDPVNPKFRLGMAEKMQSMGLHEAAVEEIIHARHGQFTPHEPW